MNAPKVTPEQVQAAIVGESFTLLPNGRTTVCQLTLYNGFTVEGQSACVCIENYDEALGNRLAREDAENKIWPLLGFRLADHLCRPALTEADAAADAAESPTPRPDFVDPTPLVLRLP